MKSAPSQPTGVIDDLRDFANLPVRVTDAVRNKVLSARVPSPGKAARQIAGVAQDVMDLPGQAAQVPAYLANESRNAVRGLGSDTRKAVGAAKGAVKGPYEDFKSWLKGED